jgi:hypothetical protein
MFVRGVLSGLALLAIFGAASVYVLTPKGVSPFGEIAFDVRLIRNFAVGIAGYGIGLLIGSGALLWFVRTVNARLALR